jgi:acyl-CoA thioester hydrolase
MADAAALLSKFPVIVRQPIVWGEMDAYRHVNNVVYFRYFEHARMAYLRRLSFDQGPREGGIGPILAATEARFRKPLTYPDEVQIGARLSEVSADRFTLEHRIVSRRQQAVVAEGKSLTVAFDYGAMTKAPLPAAVRAAIAGLEAAVGRVVNTWSSD